MATGTQIEVVMPQMGVSVSEGTITKWFKQPGDFVAQDEALLEISTDKVDTEVPSPGEGIVTEIRVTEGETVEVGTVLAVIAPAGSAVAEPVIAEPPVAPGPEPEPLLPAPPSPAQVAATSAPSVVAPDLAVPAASGNGRSFISPVVARIASEHGVDPSAIAGSGTGGRVTKKDILAYIEFGPPAPAAAVAEPVVVEPTVAAEPVVFEPTVAAEPVVFEPTVTAEPAVFEPTVTAEPAVVEPTVTAEPIVVEPTVTAEPAVAAAAPTAPPPVVAAPIPVSTAAAEPAVAAVAPSPSVPAAAAAPPAAAKQAIPSPAAATLQQGEVEEPMTAMRRGVMEHMRRSLDTSAHVTSAIEVDMSRIVAARRRLKKEYEASYGVNPTYLAFVAHTTVETLKDYPWINAEIRGETIVTRAWVNLGIAVALEEGKGLIVPVIKNAQDLNLLGMARAIGDLAARARTKKLLPDDVQGGTFTITNPGGFGTFHGTPIISQPQVGILGTYALVKRPWVVQDELGQDVIAIRPLMNITLTYDHRLVDGALSGGFLRDLRERLEGWDEE